MVVRLAYARGYLTTKNPNVIQRWGLVYYMYLDRRQYHDDRRAIQELQTFELDFDRWKQLHGFAPETVDGEAYEGVYDPREIDDFLDSYADKLEMPREMSFADLSEGGVYGMEV
jgi:hypothetical protein